MLVSTSRYSVELYSIITFFNTNLIYNRIKKALYLFYITYIYETTEN